MKTVTVDPQCRIRIGGELPETKFWLIPNEDGYQLRRIPEPDLQRPPTLKEARALLKKHSFKLTARWDEIRKETREID
jgi:hypothetical protein